MGFRGQRHAFVVQYERPVQDVDRRVQGFAINDGECDHLRGELADKDMYAFQAGDVIWADGLLVHESYPALHAVDRQFVRVSLPNNSPWFVGYTENPLGIKPCGEVVDERRI